MLFRSGYIFDTVSEIVSRTDSFSNGRVGSILKITFSDVDSNEYFENCVIICHDTVSLYDVSDIPFDTSSVISKTLIPLYVGKTWKCSEFDSSTVISIDSINVPAGKFLSYNIFRIGIPDSFYLVHDWFTPKIGFVKVHSKSDNYTEWGYNKNITLKLLSYHIEPVK